MANYIIIGGDDKEYGPVTEADVRQWIAEGRLNGSSRVKSESDAEFRTLSLFPEFAAALGAQAAPAFIAPVKTPVDFLTRDYELDIGGCITNGWELLKANMGVLFVATLIYILIQIAVSFLANIPFIGPLFSLGNFVCSGALLGGVYYLFIRVIRNEPAEISTMFSGFSRGFGQLFLGVLVPGLLMGLCMIPLIIVLIIKLVPMAPQLSQLAHMQPGTTPDPETMRALMSLLTVCIPVALICSIPATYLVVCWQYTLALIVDRQMNFAAAMRASWKMVNKHWWLNFGLLVLIGLLNVAGLMVCCIGVLFTVPLGYGALMYAYETIFDAEKT